MKRRPKPKYPKSFNFVGQMGKGDQLRLDVQLTENALYLGAIVLTKGKGKLTVARGLAPQRLDMPASAPAP